MSTYRVLGNAHSGKCKRVSIVMPQGSQSRQIPHTDSTYVTWLMTWPAESSIYILHPFQSLQVNIWHWLYCRSLWSMNVQLFSEWWTRKLDIVQWTPWAWGIYSPNIVNLGSACFPCTAIINTLIMQGAFNEAVRYTFDVLRCSVKMRFTLPSLWSNWLLHLLQWIHHLWTLIND